jgi:CheY-like chemotaxis protein
VLGIVQAGGGSILVDSDPGKGTIFELFFPTVQEPDLNTKTPIAVIPGGTEHIMVVDDESYLCQMINRLLTGLGYQVSASEHPVQALDLFKNRPQAYDLVITDLTMPKMSGIKLAQKMMKIRPDIPVILITGNGNRISQKRLCDAGVRELLFKPIVKSELAAAIRRGLNAN